MARAARSANTVTIACKLPQGLRVHLKDSDGVTQRVIHLHGEHSPGAIMGYGLTRDVPVATWEAIQKQHADAAWLVNGFVFMNSDSESVESEATERQNEKSGFEPVDPRAMPGNIQQEGAKDPAA